MKLTKKAAVTLSDSSPITYLLRTSLASCNLKNGFRRFVPHIVPKITNSQRHKKGTFIVIHFNPSRSFFSVIVGKLWLADMFCVVLLAK